MLKYKLHDVFISYRRYEDAERTDPQGLMLAEKIYDYLTSKGLRVFMDKPEMEPGDFREQLEWQLEYSPSFIFIATENAKRFRTDEEDLVEVELKTALKLLDDHPTERIVLSVLPYMTLADKQAAAARGAYTEEIRRMTNELQSVALSGPQPSGDELKEILRYVTKINRTNMWNAGCLWLQQAKEQRFRGLSIDSALFSQAGRYKAIHFPISVRQEDQEEQPLMKAIRNTRQNLYLIGSGGIGKTTALLRIMEEAYDENGSGRTERSRLNSQVPLFIELSRAPDVIPDDRGQEWQVYSGGKSTFIHREIYRQVRRDLRLRQIHEGVLPQIDDIFQVDFEVAVRPVASLLGDEKPSPEYILLLDGLNEVSRREIRKYNARGELMFSRSVVSMILDEIREIMKYKNVRVILTSRSEEAANLSEDTVVLHLSGLKPETIEQYLKDKHASQVRIDIAKHNARLQEVLRTPLFLLMYAELNGEEALLTAGEIMRLFFHQEKKGLYTQAARVERVHSDTKESSEGAEPASRVTPEMLRFTLDFILPEIAWRMVQEGEFHITLDFWKDHVDGLDEIITHVLTDKSDTGICGRCGRAVFADFRSAFRAGNSTASIAGEMVERLGANMNEVIAAVLDIAVMTLGILVSDGAEYSFVHHHIRDYFAAVYQINRLRMAVFLQSKNKGDWARDCLSDWNVHPLPMEVRRFIGETLGEAHNQPACDTQKNWQYTVPHEPCDRNLIMRGFDIYRGRFDGQDGFAVWNLVEILKAVREDLSGADFSDLDLSDCEANGHTLGRKGLAVDLHNAKLNDEFVMPRGHSSKIVSAVFSKDGLFVLTTSIDGITKLWDVRTLQVIKTLPDEKKYCAAAFIQNDTVILTVSPDNTLIAWARNSWTALRSKTVFGSEEECPRARISIILDHRNSMAAIHREQKVCIIDVNSFEILASLTSEELSGSAMGHPCFTSDGQCIIVPVDQRVISYHVVDHTATALPFMHKEGIDSVMVSFEGRAIIAYSRSFISIWSMTEKERGPVTADPAFGRFNSCICSPKMPVIYVTKGGTVEILSLDGNKVGDWNSGEFTAELLDISCDGNKALLKTATPQSLRLDNSAVILDLNTLSREGVLSGFSKDIAGIELDQRTNHFIIVSKAGHLTIWRSEPLKLIDSYQGNYALKNNYHYPNDPNGRYRLTNSPFGLRIHDANSEYITTLSDSNQYISFYRFSPSGRYIAAILKDRIVIWNTDSFDKVRTIQHKDAKVLCFSQDDKWLVSGGKGAIIWDVESGSPVAPLMVYGKLINGICFGRNDERLVTVSEDGMIIIWDIKEFRRELNKGVQTEEIPSIESGTYIPGLEVQGVDFRHIHQDSNLSYFTKIMLDQYDAIPDLSDTEIGGDEAFTTTDASGKKVVCDVLCTFSLDTTGKDYMIYTDNTYDSSGRIMVYASSYTEDEQTHRRILHAIETDEEWDAVKEALDTIRPHIG